MFKGQCREIAFLNDLFAHCSLIFSFFNFEFSNFVSSSELHPLIWFFFNFLHENESTKGPICVSYTVFHDHVGRSSKSIHNQKKRNDGISSGRGGRKGLAQCQGTQSSALGRRKK